MVSSFETDTLAKSDLIMVSSLETGSSTNPELILTFSLETCKPTNSDLTMSIFPPVMYVSVFALEYNVSRAIYLSLQSTLSSHYIYIPIIPLSRFFSPRQSISQSEYLSSPAYFPSFTVQSISTLRVVSFIQYSFFLTYHSECLISTQHFSSLPTFFFRMNVFTHSKYFLCKLGFSFLVCFYKSFYSSRIFPFLRLCSLDRVFTFLLHCLSHPVLFFPIIIRPSSSLLIS